jgi:hypothetical protein
MSPSIGVVALSLMIRARMLVKPDPRGHDFIDNGVPLRSTFPLADMFC